MSRVTRLRNSLLVAGLIAVALAAVVMVARRNRSRGPIRMRDVTLESGVTFQHSDGGSGEKYLVEAVCGGLATFDFDGDGLIDIYLLNGAPLPGAAVEPAPRNALYRNLGEMKFQDVTEQAGVGDLGYGLGVAVGDYDNDGDTDIFVNNFGPDVLYRNNGDGTFADVAQEAGVAGGPTVGAGACFLDADQDGDLDLYVANYVDFTCENNVAKTLYGLSIYAGPKDYRPVADVFYRNNGDGSFTDATAAAGLGGVVGPAKGVVCADADNDGDTDIFVQNEADGNFFFRNDGTGKFEEVGKQNGLAYNADGSATNNLGADCGDYDNDGLLDFCVTTYQAELPSLYRNLGDGVFQDALLAAGAGARALPQVTWGVGLVDFDNDGDRDLFYACGHLQDNLQQFDESASYEAPNILLMNTGDGRFIDATDRSGDGLAPVLSSRGAVFDDLDNDGDIDAVILNSRRTPTVLRNDSPGGNHWLEVELQGAGSNRQGVGAHVIVTAADLVQLDEVHSGRGYQSHFGTRLHFGLGPRHRAERVEVRWIGGGVDVLENVEADQRITVVEGSAPSAGESAPDSPDAELQLQPVLPSG